MFDENDEPEAIDFEAYRKQLKAEMKKKKEIQKKILPISSQDLYNVYQNSTLNMRVLDIRSKEEYSKDLLPKSTNIPPEKEKEIESLIFVLIENTDDFIVVISDEKNLKEFQGSYLEKVLKVLSTKDSKFKEVYYLNCPGNDFSKRYPFLCLKPSYFIPYPNEILENFLYLGGAYNGTSIEQISEIGFEYVVNISGQEKVSYPKNVNSLILDENFDWEKLFAFINECKENKKKCLIFSGNGNDRGAMIALGYLLKQNIDIETANLKLRICRYSVEISKNNMDKVKNCF